MKNPSTQTHAVAEPRRSVGLSALSALAVLAMSSACSSDSSSQEVRPEVFSAKVVRTAYGIPHITADDFGGLGYGAGYAYAADNFCVLMREIVSANGESARYFGEDEGSVNDDFVYTWLNTDHYIRETMLPALGPEFQALFRGYAAGLNRYLSETGVSNLPTGEAGCRDAEWVRPVSVIDVAKRLRKLIVRGGTGALTRLVVDAADAAPDTSTASLVPGRFLGSEPLNLGAMDLPTPEVMGSNAYGIGKEGSQTGYGILLGNPHFPWIGAERFYIQHLQIPGSLNVMGAALHGVPGVNVGFNRDLAWSHTVSTGQRFTIYELSLLEDDPYRYRYDGEEREITAHPVKISVKLSDGTLEEREKTLYMSHFGPMIDLGALSSALGDWPTSGGTAFTFRDANFDNPRIVEQIFNMGRATNVSELKTALFAVGLPWVNTIAADRAGTGFYGDVSSVPNVSVEQLDECGGTGLTAIINMQGVAAMDGSRSECEWATDVDGPPGLLGPSKLPTLTTSAEVPYVANANDSYWLSSPHKLLEGYSPLLGRTGFSAPEGIAQSLRTRLAFVQADQRIAGTDGLDGKGFNLSLVQEIMFQSRDHSAELAREAVAGICDGVTEWGTGSCGSGSLPYTAHPAAAPQACEILAGWDGRYDTDSVGPGLWRTIWEELQGTARLWAVPFDATDPVNTPHTINVERPQVVEAARCAIGRAVDFLLDGGMALDIPWGELQFKWNGDRTARIPLHGGSSDTAFSVITSNWVDGEGYSGIRHGNSYIQAVTWDETKCPVAYALLSYSQSTDPDSPHFSDLTEQYSAKQWHRMPFCDAQVRAATVSEVSISSDDE